MMESSKTIDSYLDEIDRDQFGIEWWIRLNSNPDRHLYTVLANGELYGFIILSDIKAHSARIHFAGIGKGNASQKLKIAKQAIDELMQRYNLKIVWGLVSERNKPALSFLDTLGARRSGTIPDGSYHQKRKRFYNSILLTYDGRQP